MTVEAFIEYINTHDDPALTAEMSNAMHEASLNAHRLYVNSRGKNYTCDSQDRYHDNAGQCFFRYSFHELLPFYMI